MRALVLRLDYPPRAEDLPASVEAMLDLLARRGLTDDDAGRVQEAFRTVTTHKSRWPTPNMIIDNLPSKQELPRLTSKPSPEAKEIGAEYLTGIREILKKAKGAPTRRERKGCGGDKTESSTSTS